MNRRTLQGVWEHQEKLKKRLSSLGGQWSPTHNRLLGTPPPLPAEAFSSWCWRVAAHFDIPIKTVLAHFSIAATSFWVDSGHIEPDLQRIASVTMIPLERLAVLEWAPRSILAKNEFACLTTDPLAQRPIYRYCRSCLKQDRIPYFRRLWRLGCAYLCPIHGELLRDHCPRCHTPIDLCQQPLKGVRLIRKCGHCGSDLSQGYGVHLPEELFCQIFGHQAEILNQISGSHPFPPQDFWHEKSRQIELLRRDDTGEIDLNSRQNILLLLRQMMTACLEAQNQVNTPSQCMQETVTKLLVWELDRENRPKATLAIGFDGQIIFGRTAKLISAYVKTSQGLESGTYWWPLDRGAPFEMQRWFDENLFWSAIGWIEGHGPSYRLKRCRKRTRKKNRGTSSHSTKNTQLNPQTLGKIST